VQELEGEAHHVLLAQREVCRRHHVADPQSATQATGASHQRGEMSSVVCVCVCVCGTS
jgi:hypothetical protein